MQLLSRSTALALSSLALCAAAASSAWAAPAVALKQENALLTVGKDVIGVGGSGGAAQDEGCALKAIAQVLPASNASNPSN